MSPALQPALLLGAVTVGLLVIAGLAAWAFARLVRHLESDERHWP